MRTKNIKNKKGDVMYEELLRRHKLNSYLIDNDMILGRQKSTLKVVIGGVCLGIAIVPNGLGFIFYPLGLSLLISGGIDIWSLKKAMFNRVIFWMWRSKK